MDSDEKRIAVLIDADNVSAEYISFIFDEISNHGAPTYKRIYGDFTHPRLGKWKQVLLNYSIIPIQQYSYTRGKNSTDSALIIDAMDILYSKNIDGFCIVSSDSDFTRLASRLREAGMTVIGMGERKTPAPFVNACEQFKYLEVLAASGKPDQESDAEEEEPKEERPQNKAPQHKADSQTPARSTIQRAIAAIIDDVADADGWAPLGSVGQRLNTRYPAFDSRNYGYKKLSLFVDSFRRFEVQNRTLPNQHEAQTFIRYTDSKAAKNARARAAENRRNDEQAERPRPPRRSRIRADENSLEEFLAAAAELDAEYPADNTGETVIPAALLTDLLPQKAAPASSAQDEAAEKSGADILKRGRRGRTKRDADTQPHVVEQTAEATPDTADRHTGEAPPLAVPTPEAPAEISAAAALTDVLSFPSAESGVPEAVQSEKEAVPVSPVSEAEADEDKTVSPENTEAVPAAAAEIKAPAEAAQAAETAPKKARRTRKSTAEESSDDTPEADVPKKTRRTRKSAAAEEPPEGETPKKTRRTRKSAAAEELPEAETPKKTRRTRKSAAADETPEPGAEEAPKKTRRTRKSTAAEETPEAGLTEEKPKKARRTRKSAAEEAEMTDAAADAAAAASETAASFPVDAVPGTSTVPAASSETPAEEMPKKRTRSRRSAASPDTDAVPPAAEKDRSAPEAAPAEKDTVKKTVRRTRASAAKPAAETGTETSRKTRTSRKKASAADAETASADAALTAVKEATKKAARRTKKAAAAEEADPDV